MNEWCQLVEKLLISKDEKLNASRIYKGWISQLLKETNKWTTANTAEKKIESFTTTKRKRNYQILTKKRNKREAKNKKFTENI